MKGKGAKTIKKVVSIIWALAMVVTGVNYTPVSVNAADRISIQLNGKTYTVERTSSSIVGYVMGTADKTDDVNARFVFQWDASTGPDKVTAVVKQGEETKETLENLTNGFGIYIKNIQNYEDGDYVITITDNNAESTQQAIVKLTVSTDASDKAPDYSGVTVADNDWIELGTGGEGEKWYISNSYFTALAGTGFKQMVSKGSELTYIDKDNITVTGPAIGFGIPSYEKFESAWVNDTKLAIGDKFFKSKTNYPDVLALSQDLFKDGEISYITVRYKDGTDKIIPVKRDKILLKLVGSKEMDWTKFKSTDVNNLDENGNPYIIINNGSDKRYLEYKVLDASITDVDYADIMTDVSAYGGQFIKFLINNGLPMVKSTGGTITSKMYFAQVSSYTAENYTKDMDADINYGTERKVNDGVLQTWDGNGYQLHTRSFAAGKYYIVKVVNDDGTYLTLGLRIPGDMGNWVKAKARDNSDPDKVPVVYHDKNHLIEGTIYYDGSDLGLAGMAVYNSNHLALTTDGTKKINTNGNWKMTIAYASVDDKGKFIEKIAKDTLDHIGKDPGTVELSPREEIYSTEGKNTILIKLPELMQELPIHSELGGEKDSEYYILKVYYDTENHPDKYVPVPLKIVGNIPEIEGVNGLTAGKKGDALTVSWTNSITQEADGYLYDVLIYTCDKDGINEKLVKTEEGVQAGSHTYENLVPSREIDNTNFKVKVVAHWCEQVTDAEDAVVTVISNLPNPLPGEDPDRREDKWVLIDGEYYLPINNGKGNETRAEVWYYTDENMDAVIGYNDKYITLNGNEKYFVGSNTQLFVQNDDETGRKFVAKTIYDTVYKGQLQMDAYKMFSVYEGGPASDGFYYYTVKVRDGENTDNTYNFYFRVKVTDNPTKRDNSEEWKFIKGTDTLPVKFKYSYEKQSKDNDGNTVMETVNKSLEINGTIEFYDAPDKTNTYAVTGYNSYYMSLIGKNDVYAGTNKGTNSVSMEIVNTGTEDNSSLINTDSEGNIPAAELSYASSEVYDSLYPGETQINAPTVFTVTNPTTYFMLKITGTAENGTVTTKYLPIRITVNTGNVKLEGYQINTNTAKGAVSEFNPSYRVMSSADQVILGSDNKLHGVKGFGTIYGLKSRVASASDMTVDSANKNVYTYEATSMGIYETGLFGMSNIKTEDTKRTYWALTFKHLNYSYAALVSNYVLRAYAILDNGEIVYDNDSFGFGESDVNIYNIATNLYEGKKMPNKAAHEFLFNNVISIVDINNHISQIGMAMLTKAGNENYTTVNNVYHDLFDYARGQEAYSGADEYTNRQTTGFVARSEVGSESSLLQILNTKTETTYSNLIDWIAGETTGLIHEKVVFTNNTVMN